ncbi:MAG: hypothetical protein NVSMB4_00840 [Acidimicrobiales bacterium]
MSGLLSAGPAIAVVPVRDGALPLGTDETVAEAGGRVLLAGSGTESAAAELRTARAVWTAELGAFAPGAWARRLAGALADTAMVILPASPDGRDLAPRLAHAMGRPLYAGAIMVGSDEVTMTREGGLVEESHRVTVPAVATLEPGVRGLDEPAAPPDPILLDLVDRPSPADIDAEVLAVLPPDPSTMDLAEAKRIVAGGAGLGGPDPFEILRRVASRVGASWGGSRVAADAGWIPQDRFIGTTGVTTTASLYIALGISGAVQHVTGLGDPAHIVAVNLDASAPMMAMADLAIVTDARALLDELDRLLPPMSEDG